MDLYLSLPEGTCKLFFSMTGERVRVLGSCRGLILIVTALPRRSTLQGIESESGERPRPRASAAPPLGVPCAFAHSESASVFISRRPRVGGGGDDACFGTGGGEMERFEWRRGTYLGGAPLGRLNFHS